MFGWKSSILDSILYNMYNLRMKKITSAKAREQFSQLIDDVRIKKQAFVIIRHGKAVAKLVPIADVVAEDTDKTEFEHDLKQFIERYKDTLRSLAE